MATYTPTPETVADEKPTPAPATHKRTVGQVTTAAGGGSAIGGALATLIVAIFGLDWDAPTVAALTTVLSAGLAFLGGYLVPSRKGELQAQVADALTLTQAEKEELVESATQRAAYLGAPNIPAVIHQALAEYEAGKTATEVVADEEPAAEPDPIEAESFGDGGAGLARYAL